MEPVAIIGIGCRFPGADGPDAFWQLLRNGTDAISEVPSERWKLSAFYDEDPGAPGKMNTRWGGFLKRVDGFDASFFGISPREAVHMDPQQRLLLEVTWEALEDAGQVRDSLAGEPVGVFVGISTFDYGGLQLGDPRRITDGYLNTGSALSIAANRISYFFDFRGPSMAIDTACSSSLVATHLACQSLRSGESTLALAGGVNVVLSPAVTIGFSKLKAMAADGHCKPFDARADGFVRGEGAGVVALKLLSRAIADGDPIYGVIRAAAINQDGRTNGLTAPNGLSQEELIRRTLAQAGVAPADVSYVEAHGTGTALGDPIEMNALGKVLAAGRPPEKRCSVGSVKSNIGHLEAAAGIAGLIKVALALKHGEIPPNLHFHEPNPYIPFDELPLSVQTSLTEWPRPGAAVACVSSFGFGGTNACAVLDEAPESEHAEDDQTVTERTFLLPLSGASQTALDSIVSSYRNLIGTDSGSSISHTQSSNNNDTRPSLSDLCYTASVRRTHHDARLAIAARNRAELVEALDAFQRGEARAGMSSGRKSARRRRKVAFVFSGHGAQWLGMGRDLMAKEKVFRDALQMCDDVMRGEVGWSLLDRLSLDEHASALQRVEVVQPVVFGIQVSLAALWRHWGIEPDAVVGHSMGEVAAAYVAGALTLDDATKVISRRSDLLKLVSGKGAMASVELSVDEARDTLTGYEDLVSIGVINSSRSTVLSGDPAALEEITTKLAARGVYCRPVNTDVAFHGPQIDPLTERLFESLTELHPRRAKLPIYSTVSGSVCEGSDLDASYWVKNLREPVVFSTAIRSMENDGHNIFIELGPHPVLLPAIQQEVGDADVVLVPSMKRTEDGQSQMMASLGSLYALGRPIEWANLYPSGRLARLPSYPWQRERFWVDELGSLPAAGAGDAGSGRDRGVVSAFYDSLSQTQSMHDRADSERGEAYLTFAPFSRNIPGFSWLNAFFDPERKADAAIVIKAQKELRQTLFGRVDFSGVTKVLDFGCGYASDVTTISEKHEHVRVDGFTISPEQAAIGNEKVRARGLSDRVRIFNRDSSSDEFPDQYDVVFGLEVAGHIENKTGLFSNIARHLANSGLLLMADFVANTAKTIEHEELGTYASTAPEWADVLARHGLQIVECIDVSDEIANSLDDPDFDANLVRLQRDRGLTEIVRNNLNSFNNYGKALRRKLLGYFLFMVQKDPYLLKHELRRINEDKLHHTVPYVEGLRRSRSSDDGQEHEPDALSGDELYRVEWEKKELEGEHLAVTPAGGSEGRWVIFTDEGCYGKALEASLAERGASSVLVSHGDRFVQTSESHFRVRPDSREDFERLVSALSKRPAPVIGAVHLWSFDVAPTEETMSDSLAAAESLGCSSVVHWIQSVVDGDLDAPPRLWIVTGNIQPVGDQPSALLALAQASLWGLGRAIPQEHPTLWGGLIAVDVEDVDPGGVASRVCRELTVSDGEDQITLGHDGRWVARLARFSAAVRSDSTAPVPVHEDATYLITGGLGDLGLLVSRSLVEQGARSLLLLGRSKMLPRSEWDQVDEASRMHQQIEAIRSMESVGARVHVASVDVSDEERLRDCLHQWSHEGNSPIRGVVHAAGWVGPRTLYELDPEMLSATMRPKVAGGWNLHRLLENELLDFFVLFSSVASVLGLLGQGLGHYAAANAFLDGLAHYRRSRGMPALSINWGPWSDIGMAARTDQASRLEPHGIRSFSPEHGLALFRRLLADGNGSDDAQLIAVDLDWPKLSRSFQTASRSPMLTRLIARDRAQEEQPTSAGERPSIREQVVAAQPAEREALLEKIIGQRIAGVLGVSPTELDVHRPLVEMGMDSLMGVELKNQLESELMVTLSMKELMQGGSVTRLATVLAEGLENRRSIGTDGAETIAAHSGGPTTANS